MPFKILHFQNTTAVLYLVKQKLRYLSPTSKLVEIQPKGSWVLFEYVYYRSIRFVVNYIFDTTICFEIKQPEPEDKNEQKENV